MVLMAIVPIMRKNQIRAELLECLEIQLYVGSTVRKEAGSKSVDGNNLGMRASQKRIRAMSRFYGSLFVRSEHHPLYIRVFMSFQKFEDGPAATDLNVIAMSAQTEHLQIRIAAQIGKIYAKHGSGPVRGVQVASRPPTGLRLCCTRRPGHACL